MEDNKIVEVCAECGTAACWYGEFMCGDSATAKTEKMTIKQLRNKNKESAHYWSGEKMKEIYGEPSPFGFA